MQTKSVHERSWEMFELLFNDDMRNLWRTVFPKKEATLISLATRPSQSGETRYNFVTGVDKELLQHTRDCLKAPFTKHAQGDSFWESMQLQFRCNFASTLISYRLNPTEKDTIDGLVLPMMRTLLPSISFLPNSKHMGFRAHLLTGDSIPKVVKGPGRNPEMDIVIQLVDNEERNIKLVPLEAKEHLQTKHVAQLCSYLYRLSSADDFVGKSLIGFLIDGYRLQMCICCVHKDSVLLPYFLVSPSLKWRSDEGTNVEVEGLVLFTTAIFLLDLPSLEFPVPADHADHLVHLAKENRASKKEVCPPKQLYPAIDRMLSRLDALEKSTEELAAQARRNDPNLSQDFGSPLR